MALRRYVWTVFGSLGSLVHGTVSWLLYWVGVLFLISGLFKVLFFWFVSSLSLLWYCFLFFLVIFTCWSVFRSETVLLINLGLTVKVSIHSGLYLVCLNSCIVAGFRFLFMFPSWSVFRSGTVLIINLKNILKVSFCLVCVRSVLNLVLFLGFFFCSLFRLCQCLGLELLFI